MAKNRNKQYQQSNQVQNEQVEDQTPETTEEESPATPEVVTPQEPTPELQEVVAPEADSGARVAAPTVAVQQAIASAAVSTPTKTVSAEVEQLKSYLAVYKETIDSPKAATVDAGVRVQIGFYRTILNTMAAREGFSDRFEALLQFIKENDQGVTSAAKIFRHYPSLTVDKETAERFLTATRFCMTMADPRTRAVSKRQVDLGRVLNKLGSDQITQNLSQWMQKQ